jgi:NADH-quinone oxidoreductase E subunit
LAKWTGEVEAIVLTEESKASILHARDGFPDPQSALLPALYIAQADFGGWLPQQAVEQVAVIMELPVSFVAAVASFYTLLHRQPVGRHLIQVCTNISCSLLGAGRLVDHLAEKLGIRPGETTADGKFTLLEVECLGSCGTAPMMRVDDAYYEDLTEGKIDQILAELP